MTRGFVTLATGNDEYYQQAFTLLRSFRLFHPDTPFAILCDRSNEYTKAFTDTVLLKGTHCSYRDKFFLLTDCPYDESIFIEPDCLVYHSLDHFWDLLSKKSDVSSFGYNNCENPFFTDPAYAAEKFLSKKDAGVPIFNPGYLFIRKGDVSNQVFRDAMQIIKEIEEDPVLAADPQPRCKEMIRDDPVLFIAMAMNGCECSGDPFEGKCISLPAVTKIKKISLSRGKLDATWHKPLTDCCVLHFSSRRVREDGLYAQQKMVLHLIEKGCGKPIIRFAESRPVYYVFSLSKKAAVFMKNRKGV